MSDEKSEILNSGTTLLRRRSAMRRKPLPECHGGVGALDWTTILDDATPGASPNRAVRFIHDDTLAPGVSIGIHMHTDDEEYYLILSGSGVMTLDDERFPVQTGDLTAIYPGGSHGLENTGETEMRILVIGAKPAVLTP